MFLCDSNNTALPSREAILLQYPSAVQYTNSLVLPDFVDNVCQQHGAGLQLRFEVTVLDVAQTKEIGHHSVPILNLTERVSAAWLNAFPAFVTSEEPTSSWNVCVQTTAWKGRTVDSGDVIVLWKWFSLIEDKLIFSNATRSVTLHRSEKKITQWTYWEKNYLKHKKLTKKYLL